MDSAILAFAKHTKTEDTDPTLLGRKYLAVHMPQSPQVYNHVANDFALTELRTHNPPLSSYSCDLPFHPEGLVGVVKNGIKKVIDEKRLPSYNHFVETVFPTPAGQEEWQRHEYASEYEWIRPACFLATLNCGTNDRVGFRDIVAEIIKAIPPHDDSSHKDRTDKLYSALNAYALQHNKVLLNVDPGEVASLINEVTLMDDLQDVAAVEEEVGSEEEEYVIVNEPMTLIQARSSSCDLRQHPVIQSYRTLAGLNATFSPMKILKQVICSNLNYTAGVEPILGQYQTELVSKELVGLPTADLLEHITAIPQNDEALKAIHQATKETYAPKLLAEYIALYKQDPKAPPVMLAPHVQRALLNRFPQPSAQLIQEIIKG